MNRWLGFSLALAAVVATIFWQNAVSSRGQIAPPLAATGAALSPFQSALNGAKDYALNLGRAVVRRDDSSEIQSLRAEIADLQGQNQRLMRYRRENDELRALLKMPALGGGKNLAAQVVSSSQSPLARRLTLNIGTNAGVAPGDVVFCAQGVVGQITSVGLFTSVATPIIDRNGAIGALISRSGVQGLVLGNGNRVAKLSYLNFDADVREGDVLLSSGLSNQRGAIFPRGLVIGRVLKIEKDRAYSRQEAFIEPSVPFDELSAVWVRVNQG